MPQRSPGSTKRASRSATKVILGFQKGPDMFFRGSRYESVPDAELIAPDGRTIHYKRIRFIPETHGTLTHRVTEGDRLDLIAYATYRDPEQLWRICDANRALLPEELVKEPGRRLVIPVPTI